MAVRLRNMTSLYLVTDTHALMLYRVGSRVANHKYIGSAGGHFEAPELNEPESCVIREMKEELGITPDDLTDFHLRYITYRLAGGEIRQNYYYFARLKEEKQLKSTEGDLQWMAFERIRELKMPISAKHMILHYIQRGRNTDEIYAGITRETGTDFVPLLEFEG